MKLAITTGGHWKKVQVPVGRAATMGPTDVVEVAVNVKRPNYVPDNVTVRSRATDTLFTGRATKTVLEQLERDPGVLSVQVGRFMHVPKLG